MLTFVICLKVMPSHGFDDYALNAYYVLKNVKLNLLSWKLMPCHGFHDFCNCGF